MEDFVNWRKFSLLKSVLQKCADDDVSIKSKYPTFARTYPPVVQVTKSLVALLLHFKWMKFTMIVGSSHKQRTIADKLLEYAELFNITVNGKQEYVEPYVPFSNGNPFPGIVDRTYVDTRGKIIKVFQKSFFLGGGGSEYLVNWNFTKTILKINSNFISLFDG